MDPEQALWLEQRHLLGYGVSPVAALGDVALVTEALHQDDPGLGDADRVPAGLGWLPREAVARQGRNDEIERVGRAGSMRRGIGQRPDELQLLDRRAGPAMRHDQGQRILVLRAHVDEVHVDAIDLRDEVRERREARLEPAPVVLARPVASQGLDRLEPDALTGVGLTVGQAGVGDPLTQVVKLGLSHVDLEWSDRLGDGPIGGPRSWQR